MDKRPKRFKEFDNPYTLESIEKEELYFIRFRDEKGEHLVPYQKKYLMYLMNLKNKIIT